MRRYSGGWVTVWSRVSLVGGDAADGVGAGTARAGTRLTTAGAEQLRDAGAYTTIGTWLPFGTPGDYEARCTITSTNGVGTNAGDTFNAWLPLSGNLEWRVENSSIGTTAQRSATIDIRFTPTGETVATSNYAWEAERF